MFNLPADWSVGLDDFVAVANELLPQILPEDRSSRPKVEVNPRLVRHYTTQGLLTAPIREGREARYNMRILLELLALRRLMAEGLSGPALSKGMSNRTDAELSELVNRAISETSWDRSPAVDEEIPLSSRVVELPESAPPSPERQRKVRQKKGEVGKSADSSTPLSYRNAPAPVTPQAVLEYLQSLTSGPATAKPSKIPERVTSRPQVETRHQTRVPRDSDFDVPAFLRAEEPPLQLSIVEGTRVRLSDGLEIFVTFNMQWPESSEEWKDFMSELEARLQQLAQR